MESLFLDQDFKPSFPKLAGAVKLSDNAENWQREVASEVFKQLPYLSDYAVNVILEKVDSQRGFALGSAEVSNQTDAPLSDQPKASVRVPLIVKDRLLQPMDVMAADGEVWPLNERRLREKLFRTDTFETSTRKPTDQGMVDQLFPPMRTNYGYGNSTATGSGVGGFGKQAGAPYDKIPPRGESPDEKKTIKAVQETEKAPVIKHANRDATIDRLRYQISTARSPDEKNHLRAELNEYKHIKFASATPLIAAIASTISERQFDEFTTKLAGDGEARLLALRNPTFRKLAGMVAQATPPSVEKTAHALVNSIRPTVVQLTKQASGNFTVKWANANAFMPQEAQASPDQASAMAGADLSKMAPGATVTVSTELAKKNVLDEPSAKKVTEFGDYAVKNADTGETLTGTILPVVDFDMQPLELFVFTDGAGHYGLQDEIAGVRQPGPGGMALSPPEPEAPPTPDAGGGDPMDGMPGSPSPGPGPDAGVPKMAGLGRNVVGGALLGSAAGGLTSQIGSKEMTKRERMRAGLHGVASGAVGGGFGGALGHMLKQAAAPPQGDGTFVYTPQEGAPFCTQPLTIVANTQGPDGSVQIMAQTALGEELSLNQVPGLLSFEKMSEGEYSIPAEMQWLPLMGEAIHLLKPDQPDPTADQKALGNEVDMKSTGAGDMSLDGLPVAKLARDQRLFIKTAQAEFLLVAMGMSQADARDAFMQASRDGHVKLAGLRHLIPLAHVHQEMTKKAERLLKEYDYDFWKRDLIKEAAALEDSETADKILSLNFLNPENLSTFASYLPQLDEASSKLAEMLVASRLGMSQVPEGAAERSLKNLEEVISGLRALQSKDLI